VTEFFSLDKYIQIGMSTLISSMLIKGNLRFFRLPLFQIKEICVAYSDSMCVDLIIRYADIMHGIIFPSMACFPLP
jgi:hypothetical protein